MCNYITNTCRSFICCSKLFILSESFLMNTIGYRTFHNSNESILLCSMPYIWVDTLLSLQSWAIVVVNFHTKISFSYYLREVQAAKTTNNHIVELKKCLVTTASATPDRKTTDQSGILACHGRLVRHVAGPPGQTSGIPHTGSGVVQIFSELLTHHLKEPADE